MPRNAFFKQTQIPVYLNLVDTIEDFKALNFNADEVSNGLHFHLYYKDDIVTHPETHFTQRIFDSRVTCFLVNNDVVTTFVMPLAHAYFVKLSLAPFITKARNALGIDEFNMPYDEVRKLAPLCDYSANDNKMARLYREDIQRLESTITKDQSALYELNQRMAEEPEPENGTWRTVNPADKTTMTPNS